MGLPAKAEWLPPYEYPYSDAPPPSVYQSRRHRVLQHLGPRSLLLVFAADPRLRNGDVYYPYRQSSWLWYLTGVPEPGAVLLLSSQGITVGEQRLRELLFLPDRNPTLERWEGPRMGPTEAERLLQLRALPRSQFDSLLLSVLAETDTLYIVALPTPMMRLPLSGRLLPAEREEKEWLRERSPRVVLRQGFPPLARMRAKKDSAEIRLIRRAIAITANALHQLWRQARPGIGEWELLATLEGAFRNQGADGTAFPTIVASGPNACILHYTSARRRVQENELVLVDCGAEYAGYAADITRTFPISGRFTTEQRAIYEAVLEAQDSALAACRPGLPFWLPHQRALSVLQRRLTELGLLKAPDDIRQYFPHATSHHLGLDVHDVGPTDTLRPGFVIAVEPGLYIPPGSPCDQRWWGIGVRIEDDVLITETGAEVLSATVPRRVEDIESLLSRPIRSPQRR
ncbi:MAG: aminopeptidase P N-terminal domain-containing protein [Bacteroidota bacterium]|nr:aminopeptidase P N-terminal domain-containing protein [Bacteroidota bacterium]